MFDQVSPEGGCIWVKTTENIVDFFLAVIHLEFEHINNILADGYDLLSLCGNHLQSAVREKIIVDYFLLFLVKINGG